MAIRQYVGARYVPRFSEVNDGNWSSVYSYEPLIIVKNGNDYYTSKKTVPVGIQITNTEYWVKTGDYNGAITALDNKIDNTAVQLSGDISSLSAKSIKKSRHEKIIIIGDSYERTTNFGSSVSGYLGHGATTFVGTNVQRSDDKYVYISSRGGSGFTNTENGMLTGNGFLDRLQEVVGLMDSAEKNDVSIILIAGGVNDSSVNSSDEERTMLNTNMAAFNTYARANFPNAEIKIFYLGRIRQLDTWSGRNQLNNIYNIYRYIDIGSSLGWGFISGSQYICYQRDAAISSDNLHPEVAFGSVIARNIVTGLICGSIDVAWVPYPFYRFTPISTLGGFSNIRFSANLCNGVRTISFVDEFKIGISSGASAMELLFGQPYKIGTQDGIYAVSPIEVPLPCMCWDDDLNAWEMVNGVLRFYGYDVYFINRGTPNHLNATIHLQSILSQRYISFNCDTLLT